MSWKPLLLNWRGLVFAALGLLGIWVGVQAPDYRFFGVALAMFSFFLAASFLGRAGRLAATLRPLVGRTVLVKIWGASPDGAGDGLFEVSSITGIGAGLYIHLVPESDGAGAVLKIAQPGAAGLGDTRVEIRSAAYVSWSGKKIAPPAGGVAPPVALLVP